MRALRARHFAAPRPRSASSRRASASCLGRQRLSPRGAQENPETRRFPPHWTAPAGAATFRRPRPRGAARRNSHGVLAMAYAGSKQARRRHSGRRPGGDGHRRRSPMCWWIRSTMKAARWRRSPAATAPEPSAAPAPATLEPVSPPPRQGRCRTRVSRSRMKCQAMPRLHQGRPEQDRPQSLGHRRLASPAEVPGYSVLRRHEGARGQALDL